jgi:hypothetical protein
MGKSPSQGGKQSRATRNYLGWSDPMILYHYTNLNPFFGDDEQAEAARQALGRGEQPPRAFTVLRPSSTQHPEWKPVVWLTSEPDVDRGRVPDEPPIIYVRITVVVKSTDRRLMPRQKAFRQWFQAMHPGEPYPGDPPFDDDRWRHWWAYDGEITDWREVGIVAGGGAWWWLMD